MSETYLAKLDSAMRGLSNRFGVSVEVVVVAGHELLWHSKTEHSDPDVLIRANVGFRRSLYEFDVLAQLCLSRIDWGEVEARFYVDGFFATVRRTGQKPAGCRQPLSRIAWTQCAERSLPRTSKAITWGFAALRRLSKILTGNSCIC